MPRKKPKEAPAGTLAYVRTHGNSFEAVFALDGESFAVKLNAGDALNMIEAANAYLAHVLRNRR